MKITLGKLAGQIWLSFIFTSVFMIFINQWFFLTLVIYGPIVAFILLYFMVQINKKIQKSFRYTIIPYFIYIFFVISNLIIFYFSFLTLIGVCEITGLEREVNYCVNYESMLLIALFYVLMLCVFSYVGIREAKK
ncbi:MAG TPA: hypothetical protein VHE53_04860 [Patescibacteria group bacterium]|nr:hypothetical protein [Patescibacteria group bacterium]